MHVSEVAGARVVWLLRYCRVVFFRIVRSSAFHGGYSGILAVAWALTADGVYKRVLGHSSALLASSVYGVGVAGLLCQRVVSTLCPGTAPCQGGETWHGVGASGLLCWWARRRHPLPFALCGRFHTLPRARLAGGCERV